MISFKKLFGIIFIPIAIIFALFFYFNYHINVKNINDTLFKFMSEKWIAVSALNIEEPASMETHDALRKASSGTDMRITLINGDGIVLNDSDINYTDIPNLKNHALRNEFRNANLDEPHYDIRKSASTGKNTVYYAQKLKTNDKTIVLRIAYNAEYLDKTKRNLLMESFGLAAAVILCLAFVTAFLAKKFSTPVKNLNALAENIEKGGAHDYLPQFNDPAFDKVSQIIYKIHTELAEEKNIAENEREKLNTAFKAMNEGVVHLDEEGIIIHINDKASEYLGIKLQKGQSLIKNCDNVDLIVFFTNLIENSGFINIKYKGLIFEAYSKKISDGTLIVFKEVTEKLNYETFKTELVGNLTHEIKTPLTIIMGVSETILNDKEMDEDIKNKFLQTVHKNAVRLNNLVNDALELHRLESAPNGEMVSEPANMEEIAQELKTILQTPENKEIIFDIPNVSVNIRADHILSILTNLVSNAQKYSDGDKIFVKIEKNKRRLTINVSDMGPIISENERKRIFERFYTVSKSRTATSSGSGLGLAIVKHIANLYGGKADLYQNDMDGNTFEVTLKEKLI